jgi:hypothetical protein
MSGSAIILENPIPEVFWASFDPDTVCVNWDPIVLSGGVPSGGTYSGDGVVDNIFYPAVAGFGSHEITYTYSDGNNCSNQAALNLFVDVCEGVQALNLNFVIYPNPATAKLIIQRNDSQPIEEISLFNSVGLKIIDRSGNDAIGAISLKVAELPRGTYIIKIASKNENFVKKIILQ